MKLVSLLIAFTLMAAEAPSSYARLDGARVHYQSYGQGKEALVLIHGWTCDFTFWKGQAPLYEKRRSLLIDLPGHGASDKPQIAYTPEHFARAVDAVMRHAGVEHAVLAGHSMGGRVVLACQRLFPRSVKALILVDPSLPRLPPDAAGREKFKEQIAAFAASFKGPGYPARARGFIESMLGPSTPADIRRHILEKMLATPQHVAVSAMEGNAEAMAREPQKTAIPVLAVFARNPYTPPADYLRRYFPNLTYHALDGATHFFMLESPEKFNPLVEQFLAGMK